MNRRGFMLLEIMLSVALAVLAAVAGFALLARISERVQREQDRLAGADMVSSALALIESGIVSPENLHNSVQTGVISLEPVESGQLIRDPVYRLNVDTTPTQWSGLIQVDVAVLRLDDEEQVVYSASQLVRQGRNGL
ncbi:MAG: hypothetical protein ED559_06920 [Phycisphaera sp.]|nr:MAG: hypothetical protein ED559_06920 [Phycisphaera sp.]